MSTINLKTATTTKLNALDKAFSKNASSVIELASLCLQYGQESGHYDRCARLLTILKTHNQTALISKVAEILAGKIPHKFTIKDGEYRLGAKDLSLLVSTEDLEKREKERAAARVVTSAKIKKTNADKKAKVEQFDSVKAELEQAKTQLATLKADTSAANVNQLKKQAGEITKQRDSLAVELDAAKSQIADLLSKVASQQSIIDSLSSELLNYQRVAA